MGVNQDHYWFTEKRMLEKNLTCHNFLVGGSAKRRKASVTISLIGKYKLKRFLSQIRHQPNNRVNTRRRKEFI